MNRYVYKSYRSKLIYLVAFIILFATSPVLAQAELGFFPDTLDVQIDSTFEVAVTIANVENLYGVAFDINYSPEIISTISLTEGDFLNENGSQQTIFQYYVYEDQGLIIIGLSRIENHIPGVSTVTDTPIVYIAFQAVSFGQHEITLSNIGLYRPDGSEITDFIVDDASIFVEPTSVDESALLGSNLTITAYPNPFNDLVIFKIAEINDFYRCAAFAIYDLQGRTVFKNNIFGVSRIIWDPTDSEGAGLSSGVYFYEIISHNTRISNGKITYLK